jgi:hypothetical protein
MFGETALSRTGLATDGGCALLPAVRHDPADVAARKRIAGDRQRSGQSDAQWSRFTNDRSAAGKVAHLV